MVFFLTYRVNFNPRPPRGGRRPALLRACCLSRFQSTPSARRATSSEAANVPTLGFQSTPSARRATDCLCHAGAGGLISIHALREEGDRRARFDGIDGKVFQSTPSARRATQYKRLFGFQNRNFNPRPPRGGRPTRWLPNISAVTNFNPRPPRGGRPSIIKSIRTKSGFQSTPSARRATSDHAGCVQPH